MEYEVRFYYSLDEYKNKVKKINDINLLKQNERKYEKTIQYNHSDSKYNFYSKEIDGRFRIRLTKGKKKTSCMISWKRRIKESVNNEINMEEEKELTINPNEYDNLIFIMENVLHFKRIESYERYRTTFTNSEVEISLDEYPFGLALEIEAKSDKNQKNIIDKYVKLLNLDYKDSYVLSFDDKYAELCKLQNKKVYKDVHFKKDMPQL
ncbi:MAG: hypothetical protein IJ094_09430 [Bacilli bacterium]|nr:hypothetical protein [Bacilli bacterium]